MITRFFPETMDYSIALAYAFKLIPSFLLGSSILDITNAEFYDLVDGIEY